MVDVLFLIPARSGSKGVPNKNIRKLFNIPLLAIRGLTALKLTTCENVWLSTDSILYSQIAQQFGVTVPFMRPAYLSEDTASSADVVLHAMEYAEKIGKDYKYIALLEPTSPFVYEEDLKNAIEMLRNEENSSAIVAAKVVETNSIFIQKQTKYLDVLAENLKNREGLRRQDFISEVTPAGGFYISKWDEFKKYKTFYSSSTLSYILPEESSLEIDSIIQFHWAEFMVESNIIDKNKIF